jgi:hypothetical protein
MPMRIRFTRLQGIAEGGMGRCPLEARVNVVCPLLLAPFGEIDCEKIYTTCNPCACVGSHVRSLAGIRLSLIPAYGLTT